MKVNWLFSLAKELSQLTHKKNNNLFTDDVDNGRIVVMERSSSFFNSPSRSGCEPVKAPALANRKMVKNIKHFIVKFR